MKYLCSDYIAVPVRYFVVRDLVVEIKGHFKYAVRISASVCGCTNECSKLTVMNTIYTTRSAGVFSAKQNSKQSKVLSLNTVLFIFISGHPVSVRIAPLRSAV